MLPAPRAARQQTMRVVIARVGRRAATSWPAARSKSTRTTRRCRRPPATPRSAQASPPRRSGSTAPRWPPTPPPIRPPTTSGSCSPARETTMRRWRCCGAPSAPSRATRSAGSTSGWCWPGWGRRICSPPRARSRAPSRSIRTSATASGSRRSTRGRTAPGSTSRGRCRRSGASPRRSSGRLRRPSAWSPSCSPRSRSAACWAAARRSLAESWLAPLGRATERFTFLRVLGHPAIAIAATLLVFVAPLARDPSGGVTAAIAGVLGLCLLLAAALRGRSVAGGGEQRTWPPALAFGLGGAAAGVSWAPLPVLGDKASPRLHWAAPAARGDRRAAGDRDRLVGHPADAQPRHRRPHHGRDGEPAPSSPSTAAPSPPRAGTAAGITGSRWPRC